LTSATFATRKQCMQSTTPKQPFDYCLPRDVLYGIALMRDKDPKNECYRTQLNTDMWWEPDWGAEDKVHDKPILFNATLTVSGLTEGNAYTCLRFDDPAAVPKSSFLAGSWTQRFDFTANATTAEVVVDPVMSDGSWFYRCVDA